MQIDQRDRLNYSPHFEVPTKICGSQHGTRTIPIVVKSTIFTEKQEAIEFAKSHNIKFIWQFAPYQKINIK